MLLTSWLTVLRPEPDRDLSLEYAERRDPWRLADAAYRGNPFRPPVRRSSARGCRLRPGELRWLVKRRQF